MNFSDTPEETTLRQRVRTWLKTNVPRDVGDNPIETGGRDIARLTRAKTWQRKLYDAGFVAMGWPKEYGGQGADLIAQTIVNEELVRANAPSLIGMMGIQMVGPQTWITS